MPPTHAVIRGGCMDGASIPIGGSIPQILGIQHIQQVSVYERNFDEYRHIEDILQKDSHGIIILRRKQLCED